jgi:hypothetical protein
MTPLTQVILPERNSLPFGYFNLVLKIYILEQYSRTIFEGTGYFADPKHVCMYVGIREGMNIKPKSRNFLIAQSQLVV